MGQTGVFFSRDTLAHTRLRSKRAAVAEVSGEFAAFTASIAGATVRAITQTGGVLDWETEVVRDSIYTLTDSNRRIKTSVAGRYLVRYDAGVEGNTAAGAIKTRAQILTTMRVNDVEQVWGRGLGYWKHAAEDLQDLFEFGHCSAAAVLQLAANDEVSVHAIRTDTEGANAGATKRSPNFEGQFSIWHIPTAWRLIRAKMTANSAVSDTAGQAIDFDTVEVADAGWAYSSGIFTFDPAAAGADYASISYVFMVAVTAEALITTGTAEGQLELEVGYADGFSGTVKPTAFSTSYAEGPAGMKRVACGWLGIVEGLTGELGTQLEKLRVTYRHRNTNATTFTLQASKASVQILAIPRAALDYAHARENTGGQAADVDGGVTLDTTVLESADLDHNPAGDTSRIRAVGTNMWVLGMASAYSRPISGARNGSILNHRLQLNRGAAALAQCGGIAYDRGTNGCDRGGMNAHGIVQLSTGQDLSGFHDKLNAEVDTAVDFSGPISSGNGPCKLQVIRLRAF